MTVTVFRIRFLYYSFNKAKVGRGRDKAWHWIFKLHCLLKYLCFMNSMWMSDHCFHLLFSMKLITDLSQCFASAKLMWDTEECHGCYHLGSTQGLRNINHSLSITTASEGKSSLRETEMAMGDQAAVPQTHSAAPKSCYEWCPSHSASIKMGGGFITALMPGNEG